MKRALLFLLPLLLVSCYPGETDQSLDSYQRPIVIPDGGNGGGGGNYVVNPTVNVTTEDATGITTISATLKGSWSMANASIREAGFHFGTSPMLGQIYQADLDDPGTSGSFSFVLDEILDPSKTYFYCAYVTVQAGDVIREYQGDIVWFTTEAQPDVPQPPEPQQPPAASGAQPGWAELPVMHIATYGQYMINSTDNTEYYAWHICPDVYYGSSNRLARNYTVCYSADRHCPVWVAAPRHSMYVGGSGRSEGYGKDPSIPADIQYHSKATGGGCNKGHMLGSAERTASVATNRQVFYYTNIAPQLSSGFNTGGGGWNLLEDFVDKQVCRDTLYEVLGCYFDRYTDGYNVTQTPQIIDFGGRDDVSMPTMFYYVLLRTKSGNSGKAVKDCSASELQCVAFVRAHSNSLKGQKPSAKELMSVADLEKITGVTYFPNVPNAPKSTYQASDWGL